MNHFQGLTTSKTSENMSAAIPRDPDADRKPPAHLHHDMSEVTRVFWEYYNDWRLPISIRIPRNSCTHVFTSFGSCEALKMVQKTLQTEE